MRRFVHPLVVSLLKAGQIDAFFFVRYSLGGPHIRLRLRPAAGCGERALEAMEQSARCFLDLEPSTRSVAEDSIRRANERILAGDPNEVDNSVYPDNSFRVTTFRPEIDRYGGPARLRASLDFFTLSSMAALEFLLQHKDAARPRQLAQAFCLLLQQAMCFAADRVEMSDLLRYAVDWSGGTLPRAIQQGDEVARLQMHTFLQLFRKGLTGVSSLDGEIGASAAASDFLLLGARSLSGALGGEDRLARVRIGGSHLHMTATRLGLSNAEEVYLSRLLTVTLDEVLLTRREDLSWLGKGRQSSAESHGAELENLLSSALATLVRHTPDSGTPWLGVERPTGGTDRQAVDQDLESAATSRRIEREVGR